MIGRLLYGSIRRRFQPLASIALATTMAAGTLAAAAGLGSRLAEGAAAGLHASGPNLLVRPQVGGPERLPADEIGRVAATPGVLTAVGVAFEPAAAEVVAGPEGAPVVALTAPGAGRLPVLAASEALFELRTRWEMGEPSTAPAAALVPGIAYLGARVAPTEGAETAAAGPPLRIAGTVTTGDAPDRGVIVSLADLAGVSPGVDRIEVRAEAERLEETARAIETRVAGAEARPLTRVTATETAMVRKLQLLMLGVGAVCLLLALATVGSATLALLEERRKEMALFLSLGYTGRWVQGLLTAELALVGLASVLAGSLAGEGAAAAVARALLGELDGAVVFRPSLAGIAVGCLAVAAVVSLAAALVRFRVERIDPAPVLQGR